MFLVTGGAGFIGSNLVKTLNESGINEILICDHLGESNKWVNLVQLDYKDFVDKSKLLTYLNENQPNLEAIIHLGACSDTTERDATYLMNNNYEFSKDLAQYAFKYNIRFIYASSAATYGNGEQGYIDDHSLIPSLKPLNMYGYSKQLFDLWVLKNNVQDKVVGLKYFNVYGPNETHKNHMSSMVYKAFHQVLETGQLNLFKSYNKKYDDGGQLRDFVYVKDAVKMTLSFLYNGATGIYNVGTGKAHTWNELANSIFNAMNLEPKINYIDMPDNLINQYQYFTEANMDKFESSQNLTAEFSLKEAVSDYINNYLNKTL